MSQPILDEEIHQPELPPDTVYAAFWQRALATLIDLVVFIPAGALSLYNILQLKILPLAILLTLAFPVYKIFMEYRYGATLGKRALSLKVVDPSGQPINLDQAFRRFALYATDTITTIITLVKFFALDAFQEVRTMPAYSQFLEDYSNPLLTQVSVFIVVTSIMFVIIDDKKQALHDKLAQTYCIRT